MTSNKTLELFGIKKEYKNFNLPNKLKPFTQYFYYLLEFGVIPSTLPAKKILEIFNAVVQDYTEKLIDRETLYLITSCLYNPYVVFKNNEDFPPHVDHLMASIADEDLAYLKVSSEEEDDVLIYATDPERFLELYEKRMQELLSLQDHSKENKDK